LFFAFARICLIERATVVVRQRKVIVELFFNDEHVNNRKDDVFVYGILSKEVLVDLLESLLELLDGEIGAKREFIDKIGNIGVVIIH
jgi:hypothetical protein